MNRPLIFSGLSDEQQRDLVAAAQPRQLKPRDVLGQQGEPAELFALVQIGHMKLAQVNAAGAESLVRFIGPGDCYGAIALVPGRPYPLSAIAVEPTRVLAWPRAVITGFAERLPRLKSNVFEEITRRMAGVLSTRRSCPPGACRSGSPTRCSGWPSMAATGRPTACTSCIPSGRQAPPR